jgi:hypothetical protein
MAQWISVIDTVSISKKFRSQWELLMRLIWMFQWLSDGTKGID